MRFSITPDDGTASLSATTATTDSDGQAQTTVTFGSSASGSYQITASADNYPSASVTVEVKQPPPPREISVDISPKNPGPVQPGDALTFTAEIKEDGKAVEGFLVVFRVTPNDGTASWSSSPPISLTDSNGQAQSTLTFGSGASGSYEVSTNYSSASVTVEVDAPPVAKTPETPETPPGQSGDQDQDQESKAPDQPIEEPEASGESDVPVTVVAEPKEPSPPGQSGDQDQDQESEAPDQPIEEPEASSENEEQPTPTVKLEGMSASPDSVRENDGQATNITLTVTLYKAVAADEPITLAIVTPTEGKTAKPDDDFDATLDEIITIPAGQTKGTAQLILTPKDNTTADGHKAFGVLVTSSSGHQALIDIKIADDEINDGMNGGEDDGGEDDGEVVFGFAEEVEDQAYTAGTAIAALVLPAASGGTGALKYRISSLPAGLVFDAATRTIAGAPSAATDGAVDILYTVTDEADNTDFLIFSITVNPPLSFEDFEWFFDLGSGKIVPTLPSAFALADNFPNPFNPATTIQYALPQAADVELTVYNVAGQPVRTLVAEHQSAGRYAVEWDATDDSGHPLSSGMYFYRLQAGEDFREVKKMLLLK